MRLTRLSRIRHHRVFRDFAWPQDLSPFGQFNLVYGWNGSGKTTLSTLLGHLQTRSLVSEGDVTFEIDSKAVSGSDLSTAQLPAVRVFNRDFVDATVFVSAGEIAPIYYFGQDSVEKQQQVEKLKKELVIADTETSTANANKAVAEKELDDFCVAKGKLIKEVMTSSRMQSYNNYDKRRFKQAVEALTDDTRVGLLRSDNDREMLKQQKEAQPKPAVAGVSLAVPDFGGLLARADRTLKTSVVSQVIEGLAKDSEVGVWVQRGLELHSGSRATSTCRFCGQTLDSDRMRALEGHFNDRFSRLRSEVDLLVQCMEEARQDLDSVRFPDPARVYEHLGTELEEAVCEAEKLLTAAATYLGALSEAVQRKLDTPFEASTWTAPVGQQTPDQHAVETALAAIDGIISRHNAMTAEFPSQIDRACRALEQSYLAEALPEYRERVGAVERAKDAATTASAKAQALKGDIARVEREIVEHRKPAEEFNAELCSYLGRDELRLEVSQTGYSMTRAGQPAKGLSEGERTAIAFLYFLKSLRDRSFDLANGVVVIDDPVSSLDANSLFSAFGYMKEATKGAGQLFVLTHNFCFFRQVKDWFHHLPNQKKKPALRPARFYFLQVATRGGQREAALGPLDPLLERYESEYHYLFKCLHEASQGDDLEGALEARYGMPNLARRVMEAFLSFRYPASTAKLHDVLEA
jgi:wobble nucleotide-excising tRNase